MTVRQKKHQDFIYIMKRNNKYTINMCYVNYEMNI